MTSSFEFPAYPVPRVSDAERERALGRLRDGAADGRLSHDTFVRRMELALVARRSEDLAVLTADLGARGPGGLESPLTQRLFGWVGKVSAVSAGVRRAWAAEKLPKLLLPPHGALGHALTIGRDPGSGLRLVHETVSRHHAELSLRGGLWVLRDLGSTNGTTVNGQRVTGAAVVRAGDQVGFGTMQYRLSAN
ncbi:FHA domain-containing protein [Streptomyces sp. NPDC051555]|uniref:FHA domain-containing protein n=1 Tax=Streptomyces sp. NPDC051555 TaxID=3365657 RepID=UPI00379E2BBB